jgi:hypothetical protein
MDARHQPAVVVEILQQLAGRGVGIGDGPDAVPGIVAELGLVGRDLVALDRDSPGLLDDLAERAVAPVLGAGADADHHPGGLAPAASARILTTRRTVLRATISDCGPRSYPSANIRLDEPSGGGGRNQAVLSREKTK